MSPRRAFSIASRTPRAPSSISISDTGGLATVSISAAVSPKSLIQVIGPAPSGRSFSICLSRWPMSWNSWSVFSMLSSSRTCTTEMLSCVVASTRSTLSLPVAACSILRVTSCSTLSEAIPGQGQIASPTRTGMSGSLRFGMFM